MSATTTAAGGARDAAVFPLSLGEETASELLKHLGATDVQRIGAAMSDVGQFNRALEMLKWMDARGVAESICNEHPQTIAVVLAYLEPDQSAEILSRLSPRTLPAP